jgi:hypothetical protein
MLINFSDPSDGLSTQKFYRFPQIRGNPPKEHKNSYLPVMASNHKSFLPITLQLPFHPSWLPQPVYPPPSDALRAFLWMLSALCARRLLLLQGLMMKSQVSLMTKRWWMRKSMQVPYPLFPNYPPCQTFPLNRGAYSLRTSTLQSLKMISSSSCLILICPMSCWFELRKRCMMRSRSSVKQDVLLSRARTTSPLHLKYLLQLDVPSPRANRKPGAAVGAPKDRPKTTWLNNSLTLRNGSLKP